ncbi:MAG: hypothetical protein M3Z26_00430 [Bacteroidota bacterium]|nr:hypothetical protein [Bacteroidota bacterium]
MEYDVYKKILASLESIHTNASVAIIDSLYKNTFHLDEVFKSVQEHLIILNELHNDLSIELDLNANEDEEKVTIYRANLLDKLNSQRTKLIEVIEDWGINKDFADSITKDFEQSFGQSLKMSKKMNGIDLIILSEVIIRELITTINDWENPIQSTEHFALATKILYLHFSGLLEIIRNQLEENGIKVNNKRLAKTLALIINGKENSIAILLSQLTVIIQGNPHIAFTKLMIEVAYKNLKEDGFGTSILETFLDNMEPQN